MSLASRRRYGRELRARRVSDDWYAILREHARPVVVDGRDVYCVCGQLEDTWVMASLSDYVWHGDGQTTPHHGWRAPQGYIPIRAWMPAGSPWLTRDYRGDLPDWQQDDAYYVQRKGCPVDEPWLRRELYYARPDDYEAYLDGITVLSTPLVYDLMRMDGY